MDTYIDDVQDVAPKDLLIAMAYALYENRQYGKTRDKTLRTFKDTCTCAGYDWRLIAWSAKMLLKINKAYNKGASYLKID